MSVYVLPQTEVFQDFTAAPTAVANPLRAHISGPNAKLVRYVNADEKADGFLGYYDRLLDNPYAWPARPAGAVVDQAYTGVTIQDALLLYFQDVISSGSTITKVTGYNNRIASNTINFRDHGTTYPRDASLLDRDVKNGDVVKVRGLDGSSNSITLWTYIKDVLGDIVDGTVRAATGDVANAASQGSSGLVAKVAGPDNCVNLQLDISSYDGLADGAITETYDILVTEGSVGGDFTTATLRVISGSGEDDQAAVTPSAVATPTAIGTRGLTVDFDIDHTAGCSTSATDDDVSPTDLVVGQRWQVTVDQAFTPPVATSAGTYDGAADTTYIVTVSRGGLYSGSDLPQVSVTTTTGIDVSGPTDVTAASSLIAVGTHGAEIEFSGTGLRKGDIYYIVVAAPATGPMRTIVLGHNLDTTIPAGSEVDLTLFIRVPALTVPQDRIGFAPVHNWDTSATELTLASGIIAYEASWTDSGVQQPLDVYSEETLGYGQVFATARYWLADMTTAVNFLSSDEDIDTIPGPLDPDNPLKWGVLKARENANGTPIGYTAVANPDSVDSWAAALDLLVGRDDTYGLVPLTRNKTVLDAYAAHVEAMSAPEEALWRVLWTNLAGVPTIPVVADGSDIPGHTTATTSDGAVALAVVEDDPQTSGTQYTIVRCTSGNAKFLTVGVRPGDTVRVLYTDDGFGHSAYSEFVVDAVISEDELRLVSGPAAAISVAAKFEVWRALTATEEATAIGTYAGSWGSRRVRAVWPDQIENSGTVMEGYFLCAALAGLTSGVLPHQGLTRLAITGFTAVPRTTAKFNRAQLDTMAGAGTWIVTQNVTPGNVGLGEVYSRHAVTTGDTSDVNQREEMVTRNVDSISFRFKDQFAPFIGVTNVTPVMVARISQEASILIGELKSTSNVDLGGQLIDATIVSVRRHAILLDRIIVQLQLVIPYALNVIEIHLAI
jgi:hypothetical protein